jgi:hypothetical protein
VIRKAWTAYAALLSAAIVAGEALNFAGGSRVDARALAGWVVTGVLLCATWGYALQRPIGPRRYWRPAFWVVLSATAATLVPPFLAGRVAITVSVVLLAFVVPAFVAAYLYAYRCAPLWPAGKGDDS